MAIGLDVTAIDTTAKFKLGTIFSDIGVNGPCKTYKYVLFNNGAGNVAAVVGNFCYYYLAGGYQDSTVTMDVTDSNGMGAGLFQAILTDGAYGWIQIEGPATMTTAATAGADGNALTAIGAGADGVVDVSALVTDAICAIADDISADEVYLCCPK